MSLVSSSSLNRAEPFTSPRRQSVSWRLSPHPASQRRSQVDIVSPESYPDEPKYPGILSQESQRLTLLDCDLDVELRHPRINPQKARRHCVNFGFGQEEEDGDGEGSPSTILSHGSLSDDEMGSAVPSPISDPELESGDESDYSSLKDIEMEFPKPPSISPMLRRMRSSPSFAESAHLFRHTARPTRPPNSFAKHMLEMTPPPTHLNFRDNTGGRTNGLAKAFESRSSADSVAGRGRRNSVAGTGWERTHRASRTEPIASPHLRRQSTSTDKTRPLFLPVDSDADATPKAARRISSNSVVPKPEPSVAARTIHKMRSLKFRTSDGPGRGEDKARLAHPLLMKGRSISMEFNKSGSASSSQSSGLSFMAARKPHVDSKPPRRYPSKVDEAFERELHSFIDIAPESRNPFKQAGKEGAGKDRVRHLWQKASTGLGEWRRGLSKKQK